MNQSSLFDLAQARNEVNLRGLYSSKCTVQQATNATDALGQVDLTDTGFVNIAGVVNVGCMRAPNSMARIVAGTTDTATLSEAFNLFHVLLDDYYPQIPEAVQGRSELRCIIDGVVHEVLGVEASSQRTSARQTRLECRQVGV